MLGGVSEQERAPADGQCRYVPPILALLVLFIVCLLGVAFTHVSNGSTSFSTELRSLNLPYPALRSMHLRERPESIEKGHDSTPILSNLQSSLELREGPEVTVKGHDFADLLSKAQSALDLREGPEVTMKGHDSANPPHPQSASTLREGPEVTVKGHNSADLLSNPQSALEVHEAPEVTVKGHNSADLLSNPQSALELREGPEVTVKGHNSADLLSNSQSAPESSESNEDAHFHFATILKGGEDLCFILTPITAMILTKLSDRDGRIFFRDNIHKMTEGEVRPFFPVGRPTPESDKSLMEAIEEEAALYGDILLANFTDAYQTLSAKVVTGLKFVNDCQPRPVKLLIKIDDDVVVNWHVLLHALRDMVDHGVWDEEDGRQLTIDSDPIWSGYRWHNMRVISDKNSKNYEDVPFEHFPDYASGPAYIMNWKFIDLLITERAKDAHVYNNEDAMMGILASRLGLKPLHDPRFVIMGDSWIENACGPDVKEISDCDCERWFIFHTTHRKHGWEAGHEGAQLCAEKLEGPSARILHSQSSYEE